MGLFTKTPKPGVTAYEAKKALAEIRVGDHKWTPTQKAHAEGRLMGYINANSPVSEKGRMAADEVNAYMHGLKTDQHKLGLTDDQIKKMEGAMDKYVKKNVTRPQFFG
jgi:hypothetical protein